jgi:CHAT domain-containing protein
MSSKRVVLAEYFTVEDRTLLFIVREDFEKPVVIEIEKRIEEIQEFVKKHFQAGNNEAGCFESTSDKVNKLDENEYQSFFAPFVEPLVSESPKGDLMTEEGDTIWIVPHNYLHYLPLHALKVGGRHLIERNPVCYTSSASVMKYCHQKRKEKREKALIFADSGEDRLFTQVQGLIIKELFNPNAEIYIGKQVTKDLLKQKLNDDRYEIDILHIACHGTFNAVEALKSGIQFAEGEKLTAEEIFSLLINADLVTLSACDSGINDNKPGDELIGLTRALIYAGTPSVVVSLWSVDQISTSILMSLFYRKLKEGVNKAEALQQAQLELRKMTALEIIDYCTKAKENIARYPELTNVLLVEQLLDEHIADIRWNIKDFKGAYDDYRRLRDRAEPNSNEYEKLDESMMDCEGAGLTDAPPEAYKTFIYNSLYHWAPFILVGDWR